MKTLSKLMLGLFIALMPLSLFAATATATIGSTVESAISIETGAVSGDILYNDYASDVGFVVPTATTASHTITFDVMGTEETIDITAKITSTNALSQVITFNLASSDPSATGSGTGAAGTNVSDSILSDEITVANVITGITSPSAQRTSTITLTPIKIALDDLSGVTFDTSRQIEITYTIATAV